MQDVSAQRGDKGGILLALNDGYRNEPYIGEQMAIFNETQGGEIKLFCLPQGECIWT